MKPCKRIHACRASSYLSVPGRNQTCELVRHLPAISGPAKRVKSAQSKRSYFTRIIANRPTDGTPTNDRYAVSKTLFTDSCTVALVLGTW